MKTIAFLAHNKSFTRIVPDVKALRQLGVKIVLLSNSKELRPNFIDELEFFEVNLGNDIEIANILSKFDITALVTPSDHLISTVVRVCNILKIKPPCDLATAEIFINKYTHILDAQAHGMADYVPKCAIIKNHNDLMTLGNTMPGALFIKPDIGCGMRGVFPSDTKDAFIFEYQGLKNVGELLSLLNKHDIVDEFITYCTTGKAAKYYYPTTPKALIQEFYHTNKSYTIQYVIINGEWYYVTTGQVFYWVQASDLRTGQMLNPLQDPRTRLTDGTQLCTEEMGYYHLPEIPEHIFSFAQKCVEYMKSRFKINNMGLTLGIHETIDGKFLMTDLNPRVGGQWVINYQFSQPNFYLNYWDAFLHGAPASFEHKGPLGCINPIFIKPGKIKSSVLPEDTSTRIITYRERMAPGQIVPKIQSMNSRDWEVKVYTAGKDLDEQVKNVLEVIQFMRDNIAYE